MELTPPRAIAVAFPLVVLLTSSALVGQPGPAPTTGPATAAKQIDLSRFEKQIVAYEQADRDSPPANGGVVFIGSSTIRMWKTLAADYPAHNVIKRGFGGSTIAEATRYADRIVIPYKPRQIMLRAGTNDIHLGLSPERVAADFRAFVEKVRARLPDAEIVFTSINPAPVRWHERDAVREANALIDDYCARTPGLKYVETHDMVIGPGGGIREELFLPDRLHFNPDGYKLLAERLRPHVK